MRYLYDALQKGTTICTRHIILGHLSKENNFPQLALQCCECALRAHGIIPDADVRVDVASRDGVTGIYGISCLFE